MHSRDIAKRLAGLAELSNSLKSGDLAAIEIHKSARSQAIDDCIKVVAEIEQAYAEDGQILVVVATKVIASRLEALKGST